LFLAACSQPQATEINIV